MGLGLLGRGLGDAIFLAEHGAELIVTDLRDEKILEPSLSKLRNLKTSKPITFVLGQHRLEDFRNRPKASGDARGPDFILKAAGVSLDSPYIAEAEKHGVPIEMDASLFAKLMPKGVTLVGVTGTRGKSTTTSLIYEILSTGLPSISKEGTGGVVGRRIFKGGNLVPEATLPLLEKVRAGDIVVLELDSWQLQGFHDAKLSPQVAVFTTFLDDHLIYYKGDTDRYFEDKVAIFKYQKSGDVLIAGERVAETIGKSGVSVNGDFVIAKKEDVPSPPAGGWKIPLLGEHNLENIACALAVAKHFNIPEAAIKKAVENFKPVPGRLEFIREVKGVKIYNDNNATTPDATIAALRALSPLTKGALPSPACAEASAGRSAGGLSQPPKVVPDNNPPRQPPLLRGITTPVPHFSEKVGDTPFTKGDIILIMGGTDKGLDMSKLVAEIPKHCKAVVMLKETGTDRLLSEFPGLKSPLIKGVPESARAGVVSPLGKGVPHSDAGRVVFALKENLKECVQKAMKLAEHGDIVLFSPALASFGKWFKNEYDRGEQFVALVNSISNGKNK